MAIDICLLVLKYSHAIGVRDNVIPWTHITASDIFVIVQGTDNHIVDGKLTWRVVQGTKVLEDVNIANYIDNAIETRRRIEQAGVTANIEQLPIFGITKEAILAIRYRLSDGESRRIQLRLQNQAECRQIVDCFQRRGMQFQEQRPRTAARPDTAIPTTDSSQARPLTMQTPSPYFDSAHSPTTVSPFANQEALEAGSLSSYQVPPNCSPTRGGARVEQPQVPIRQMPPPTFFSRDVVAVPRDVVPERPTTSQIYRSNTTISQPSQYDAPEVRTQAPAIAVERPSSAAQISNFEAIREATERHEDPPYSNTGLNLSSYQPPHSNEAWSSTFTAQNRSTIFSSDPTEPRPSTSASTPFPDTLEHEIPPRRELPFKDHESLSNASDRPGSRPISALTLPPLPKPTLAKEGSSSSIRPTTVSPTKAITVSRPASSTKGVSIARPSTTASPSKRPFTVQDDDEKERVQPRKVAVVVKPGGLPREQSSKVSTATSAKVAITTPGPMNELLYGRGRKPLTCGSANTTKVSRVSSLADAPHENVSPPASPSKSAAPSTSSAHDPTIRAHAALVVSAGHDPDAVSLENFAARNESERQAALEEFFIRNWDNEGFISLCEDVEKCWRRIALGL